MGALPALCAHNPLHDFYERLVGRGKAQKLALMAALRKLLTWGLGHFFHRSCLEAGVARRLSTIRP